MIGSEIVRLARGVLEGGEFADVRAADLCEMVLRGVLKDHGQEAKPG